MFDLITTHIFGKMNQTQANIVQIVYLYTNSTRHASRQISVPGRVFYFIGYAVS